MKFPSGNREDHAGGLLAGLTVDPAWSVSPHAVVLAGSPH